MIYLLDVNVLLVFRPEPQPPLVSLLKVPQL
jgi:hypothetical protein